MAEPARDGTRRLIANTLLINEGVPDLSCQSPPPPQSSITWSKRLWLVTSQAGSRRGGLIATFITRASLVPDVPRVVAGIAKHHYTSSIIQAGGAFVLHLVAEEHIEWVWRFGMQSGRNVDKFAGLSLEAGTTGCPILTDAIAWLECSVEIGYDTGDRTLFLAEIVNAKQNNDRRPLTSQRMAERATPAQLAELKAQRHHDCELDKAAIHAWRVGRKK